MISLTPVSVRGLAGLGASPPPRPDSRHAWYMYTWADGTPVTDCSVVPLTNSQWYCTMNDGVGWFLAGTELVVPRVIPGLSPTQRQALNDHCATQDWPAWLNAFPNYAKCLGDAGKTYFVNLCYAVATGQMSTQNQQMLWTKYVDQACAAKAPQPAASPSTTTAPAPSISCSDVYDKWLAHNPQYIACMHGDVGKHYFVTLCNKINNGRLTAAQAGQTWNNYVQHYCSAPAPASAPPGPNGGSVPSMPGLPATAPSDDTTTSSAAVLRHWGPIVGFGLIAALGLTYARNKMGGKKLTRRKNRR